VVGGFVDATVVDVVVGEADVLVSATVDGVEELVTTTGAVGLGLMPLSVTGARARAVENTAKPMQKAKAAPVPIG
jgi:hypothetical protein